MGYGWKGEEGDRRTDGQRSRGRRDLCLYLAYLSLLGRLQPCEDTCSLLGSVVWFLNLSIRDLRIVLSSLCVE